MKKLLLFSLLISATLLSQAQIERGTIMLGGSARFNQYNNSKTDASNTSLIFSPQFGIAFAENFIGGAYFSFSSFSNVSAWSVAPFARYFKGNMYTQVGIGYNDNGYTGQSMFDFRLGYSAFIKDNIALEPALYFNQYFKEGLNGSDVGLRLGFQLYFNR